MLRERDRAAYLALHPYAYVNTERSEDGRHVQLHLASRARTDEVLCPSCGRTFCEEIPFRHPQTRVTGRAAAWAGSVFLQEAISKNTKRIQHLITNLKLYTSPPF